MARIRNLPTLPWVVRSNKSMAGSQPIGVLVALATRTLSDPYLGGFRPSWGSIRRYSGAGTETKNPASPCDAGTLEVRWYVTLVRKSRQTPCTVVQRDPP